jgi:hypothetical protein
MSRGLGKLQREIIETLDEAKQQFSDAFYRTESEVRHKA